MCKCINIPMGSYKNASAVTTPSGSIIDLDNCILDEVKGLWELGITTVESCCGHNVTDGYILVDEKSIWKMLAVGYKNHSDVMGEFRPEIFYPKSTS
jgi:hypothetical protein